MCHTTEESPNVHVWIEGPDTMISGHTANYKMYMFGGPAISGGYNVAVYYGLLGLQILYHYRLIMSLLKVFRCLLIL